VVLGHSGCGAISATLEELERPTENRSSNLLTIVDHIRPSVEALLETGTESKRDSLMQLAVRANICSSTSHLRYGSPILEELVRTGKLTVVGAEYSLETGVVDFFDGLPEET
jgi:carbonic anhydrase